MTDHPGGLRPPPLLIRGGENKFTAVIFSLLTMVIFSLLTMVIFSLLTMVISSLHEAGCSRSGQGGRWRK
jgi:hypothetical protein